MSSTAVPIYLRMPAFGLTGPWRERPGFAQTMEQLTGMAWITGHLDDQPRIMRGPCDPIAGLHGAIALMVALWERERTGEGVFVESTMVEAALNCAAEQIIEYTAYGNVMMRSGNRSPHAAPQGVYACPGFEQWLAISVATDEQWEGLRRALGSPAWADDPALVDSCRPPRAPRRHRRGLGRMGGSAATSTMPSHDCWNAECPRLVVGIRGSRASTRR